MYNFAQLFPTPPKIFFSFLKKGSSTGGCNSARSQDYTANFAGLLWRHLTTICGEQDKQDRQKKTGETGKAWLTFKDDFPGHLCGQLLQFLQCLCCHKEWSPNFIIIWGLSLFILVLSLTSSTMSTTNLLPVVTHLMLFVRYLPLLIVNFCFAY